MNRESIKIYLVFIAAFLVMHYMGEAVSGGPYVVGAIRVFAAVLIVFLLLGKAVHGRSIKATMYDMGFGKTNLSGLAASMVISAAVICTYPLLGYALHIRVRLAEDWQWNLVGLMFTAGVTEEMLFRGYLFGGFRREMSFRKAVFRSAVCFTIAHLVMFTYMDWPIALMSTLLAVSTSVPLAFLFEMGHGTIWGPAILHTAIRTVGMVVTTDQQNFMQFAVLWMVSCMMLPYIVLLFSKDFRSVWVRQG